MFKRLTYGDGNRSAFRMFKSSTSHVQLYSSLPLSMVGLSCSSGIAQSHQMGKLSKEVIVWLVDQL